MTKKLKQENTLKKKITVYPNKFLPEIERYSKRLEHKGIQCFEINLDEIYSKERMSKVYKELGMKQPDSTHDVVKSLNGYLGEFELIDFIFMSMYPKENGSIKHTGLIGFRMITDNNEQLKHHLDELIYGYTGSAICNVSELKGSTDIYKTLTKMVWHWNWVVNNKPKAIFSSFSEITVNIHGDFFGGLKSSGGTELDPIEWKNLIWTNLNPLKPGWCLQKPVLKGKKNWVDNLNFNQISENAKCLFYVNLYLQINEIIICDKYLYVKNKNAKQTYQKLGGYRYLLNSPMLIKSLVKHFPKMLTENNVINVFKDPQLLEDVLLKCTPLLQTDEHICYNTIEFKNGIYLIPEDTFLGHENKNKTKCSKYFDTNFEKIQYSVPTAWLEYLQNSVKDVNEKCIYFGQILNKKGLKNMQFNKSLKKQKTLLLTAKLINLQENTTPTKTKLQVESLCKQMGISENFFFKIKNEEAKILTYCNKKYKLLLSENKGRYV